MANVSVGGASLSTSLNAQQAALATALLSGTTIGQVNYVAPGGIVTQGAGKTATIINNSNKTADTTLTSNVSGGILVGNQGNDLFNLSTDGAVIAGNGNDTVRSTYVGPNNTTVILGKGDNLVDLRSAGTVATSTGND